MYGRNKICIARVMDKQVLPFVFIIFNADNKSSSDVSTHSIS